MDKLTHVIAGLFALLLVATLVACNGVAAVDGDAQVDAAPAFFPDGAINYDAGSCAPACFGPTGCVPGCVGDVDAGADAGVLGAGPATPITVAFPQTPPDAVSAHGTTPDGHTSWVAGDSWTGTRSTTLDSTTHADVWLYATANGACPGAPFLVHITLNGTYIGDVGFTETTVGSLVHLDFPAVDGPTYDIAYGVDESACGQIVVDAADPRNTITLSP